MRVRGVGRNGACTCTVIIVHMYMYIYDDFETYM